MLFNSYIFTLLFLPTVVLCYFLFDKISLVFSHVFLIGMSLWFYGYFNPWYLFVLCGSILGNYALSKVLEKNQQTGVSKLILALGIALKSFGAFFMGSPAFFTEYFKRAMTSSMLLCGGSSLSFM